MSTDPKSVVRRFLDEAYDREEQRWRPDVVVECFDVERYHSHTWGAGLIETGRRMGEFFAGFADRELLGEALVAEGDLVVHRVSSRARHVGPMLGVPATDRQVEVHHVEMWRVEDGKIVEHWGGIGEAHHLYEQLTG